MTTAWVTGASSGIGKAIAKQLVQNGMRVVISARNELKLQQAADSIDKNRDHLKVIACDSSKSKDVKTLINTVQKDWGSIDVLINNAGVAYFADILDLTDEQWDEMMRANAKSAFVCSRAVLPDMIKRQSGHIINIVSVAGQKPFPGSGGYCASKFAMQGFTDVLRMEVRQYGIQVTALLPGATDTPLWGDADIDASKMIKPNTIADVVLNLIHTPDDAMIETVVMRPQGGDL